MNLGDPDLELIDPTPNVHTLFIHFDKLFFWTKLASRAVVRWSKRMYSCAGVCSYEGRGGLCDIALSEPLLKLRPRKDLIETLLHEMIHAFLFVTNRDQDRDGHGPNFQSHMHRINKSAGLNISIYHDFHDEVKLYQTHWWRCDGPCQKSKPYFGIVRRSSNTAPGPRDFWWCRHKQTCGGTFIKIKEPENFKPRKQKSDPKVTKPKADITKYITNNVNTINQPAVNNKSKPVLNDASNLPVKTKPNSSSTVVVTKKGVIYNPTNEKPHTQPIPVFTGTGNVISPTGNRTKSTDVAETVRNIWANKQIPTKNEKPKPNLASIKSQVETIVKNEASSKAKASKVGLSNPSKHKVDTSDIKSPPAKVKKIDDYFKATSLLNDLYGEDIKLTNNGKKLVAVTATNTTVVIKTDLVDCPVCSAKVSKEEINKHLDECLNKDIIEKLSQNSTVVTEVKPIVAKSPDVFKTSTPKTTNNNIVDLTDFSTYVNTFNDKSRRKTASEIDKKPSSLEQDNLSSKKDLKSDSNKNILVRRSDNFVTKERGDEISGVKLKIERDDFKIIKDEPSTSKSPEPEQNCPCCGEKINKPIQEHLDECLAFFNDDNTVINEGASTSAGNVTTMVIDDEDDIFDETIALNATGTKTPCPCCMKMVEIGDMNDHLDVCLQ